MAGNPSYIGMPTDGAGKRVQTWDNTLAQGDVYTEAVTITDSTGTEKATSTNPLRVDPTGDTIQPVSGTVTSNIGTTNGLALDTTVSSTNVSIAATTAPSKITIVGGKSNDGTPQYQPIPLGAAGRSVIIEGVAGGTAVPISGTVTVGSVTANQGTAAAVTAGWPVIGGQTVQTTAAWTNATTINTALTLSVSGYSNVIVTLSQVGSCLLGVLTFEVADAAGNWYAITGTQPGSTAAVGVVEFSHNLQTTTVLLSWCVNVSGFAQFRVRLSTAISGAAGGTANIGIDASLGIPAAAGTFLFGGPIPSGTNVIGHVIVDSGAIAVTQTTSPWIVAGGGTAGTAASGVVTVQGIASMTKLLVTPDSVALPANQSVNISQINATTPLMGNGVTGTGSQRVTIASDNTAFSVNATLSAETTKVIGTARVIGNAGAAFDAVADGATSPPANAVYTGMLAATALPSAYTTAKLAPPMTDKFGRQVVVQNTVRDLIGTNTVQTTDTSSHDLIAAASLGSGVFGDITFLVVTNETATATVVSLADGTKTYKIALAANGGAVMPIGGTLPGSSSNTAWTVTSSASVTLDFIVTYAKNK